MKLQLPPINYYKNIMYTVTVLMILSLAFMSYTVSGYTHSTYILNQYPLSLNNQNHYSESLIKKNNIKLKFKNLPSLPITKSRALASSQMSKHIIANSNLFRSSPQMIEYIKKLHLPLKSLLYISAVNKYKKFLDPCLQVIAQNNKTIALSLLFILRFYKTLLYIRYVLEWLPQVNPYLQPFSSIYRATDAYMTIIQFLIPSVLGIDLSGFASWLFLESTDSTLSSFAGLTKTASKS